MLAMRVFFAFLIIAIAFSGFSTASHAFDMEGCTEMMKSEMSKDMDMADCPGHQKNDAKKDTDNTAKKSACPDCVHCCTSHAVSLTNFSVKLLPVEATLASPPLQVLKSDLLFSLLRPPKSLV
jgi:hypothetical protein